MSNAPCRYCEVREVGCHSKCEAYKQFVQYNEHIKKMRHKESIEHSTLFSSQHFYKPF